MPGGECSGEGETVTRFSSSVKRIHPRATPKMKRREFGRLVETTVAQRLNQVSPAHSGIRFPQNACVSCAHLELCLNNQRLIAANLIRRPGSKFPRLA